MPKKKKYDRVIWPRSEKFILDEVAVNSTPHQLDICHMFGDKRFYVVHTDLGKGVAMIEGVFDTLETAVAFAKGYKFPFERSNERLMEQTDRAIADRREEEEERGHNR